MKQWLARAAAVAALTGCTTMPQQPPHPINLDPLFAFDDPALCLESKTQTRFISAMVSGDANEGFRPGEIVVPRHFSQAFGKIAVRRESGFWVVSVPIRGFWLGMPVREIIQTLPQGGDPGDFYFSLGVPISEAERRLKAAGFPVVAGSAVSLGEPNGYDHQMSLYPDPDNAGRSLFGCGYS